MKLGEIIGESWGAYKRNLIAFALPFLILLIATAVVYNLMASPSITSYPEERTHIIAGENLSPPDTIDANDENFFEIKADENCRLEILHDSKSISGADIPDCQIMVYLNFGPSASATCRLDIYNFSDNFWENSKSGVIDEENETWTIKKVTDIGDYLSSENFVRIRLVAENVEDVCREDALCYVVIQPPKLLNISVTYLVFLLGFVFCSGVTIGTTHLEKLKGHAGFWHVLKIVGQNYPRMLAVAFIVALPSAGVMYSLDGVLPALPAILLLLFLCIYAWPGIVIHHLSPWNSIIRSIRIIRENPWTASVLFFLPVFIGFLLDSIAFIGTLLLWLLLFPLWIAAISVTYMSWTGGSQQG